MSDDESTAAGTPTVIESEKDSSEGGFFSMFAPLGRVSMHYYFRLLDAAAVWRDSGNRFSYEPTTNRLRLSGESENAGDRLDRARHLYLSMTLHTFIWLMIGMYAMWGYGETGVESLFSASVGLLLSVVATGSIIMAMGGIEAFQRCEIIDYTTEPAPETDDLGQQYVDGEIESVDELEAQAEARLE